MKRTANRSGGRKLVNSSHGQLFVAHTLKDGRTRHQINQLVLGIEKRQKNAVIINPIDTMHLTLLSGLTRLMHVKSYAHSNSESLVDLFEKFIKEEVGTEQVNVWVHEKTPLIAVGRKLDKLALRIQPDAALKTRQKALNGFVSKYIDSWNPLPFNPHISLGLMVGHALWALRNNPNHFIQNTSVLPEQLALNGVKLYREVIR